MKTKHLFLVAGTLLATIATGLGQPCITITNQPQNQTTCYGSTATFTVSATGTEPLSYQWQQSFDGITFSDRPDSTNATLQITNVQAGDRGTYWVLITNVECTVTSTAASLTPIWSGPSIPTSGQPTNWPSVSLGVNLTNRVNAGGPMLTYQWRLNGNPLPGQTKSTIILTDVQMTDAGNYDVLVANACGSIPSRIVPLSVDTNFVVMTNLGPGSADMWYPYWVDLDGDGWQDLVALGGVYTPSGQPLMVFQNNRGTLIRTLTHDLSKISGFFISMTWADFDNDGDLDGFVGTKPPQPALYLRNDGGGKFTKIIANSLWTANRIPAVGMIVTSADFENDGFLDIIIGYWGDYPAGVWGTNTVLHGLGAGLFEVDLESPLAMSRTYPENFSWADWDGDGRPDLFAATSGNTSPLDLMFENLGGGQFLRITDSPLVQVPDIAVNAAWSDYDNDGDLDVCVTRRTSSNQLYRNAGNGVFELDPSSPPFPAGQGRSVAAWADYDNDGWPDLFITSYNKLGRLFHNRGDGTLEEVFTGSPVNESQGYGCAWGDYDNDGFPDLCVIGFNNGRNYLYRNNLRNAGNTNGWLKIQLVGKASNQSGIGATIRVNATISGKELRQMRQLACNTAEPAMLAHFGLSDATNVTTLRIEWPSGIVQELQNVPANQFLTVVESQGYVGAPPQFSGAVKTAGGVELSFVEPAAGARYLLEASTNLVTWTKLMARTSGGGSAQFTDSRATNYTKRFYRLQVP